MNSHERKSEHLLTESDDLDLYSYISKWFVTYLWLRILFCQILLFVTLEFLNLKIKINYLQTKLTTVRLSATTSSFTQLKHFPVLCWFGV
jgi:hypothetical protein